MSFILVLVSLLFSCNVIANQFVKEEKLGFSKVIGEDTRKQVTNTKKFPYKVIGQLIYTKNGEGYRCTGTLVGPKHVLTAGHCVWSAGSWAKGVIFVPGKNGKTEPYGRFKYDKVVTNKTYYDSGNSQYDYGMVILKDRAGDELGMMEMDVYDADEMSLNLAGYPGDKSSGTMWRAYCPVVTELDRLLLHECDTSSGMSGALMYRYNKAKGSRVVYAIHAGTYGNKNRATKLNQDFFNTIQDWIEKYD